MNWLVTWLAVCCFSNQSRYSTTIINHATCNSATLSKLAKILFIYILHNFFMLQRNIHIFEHKLIFYKVTAICFGSQSQWLHYVGQYRYCLWYTPCTSGQPAQRDQKFPAAARQNPQIKAQTLPPCLKTIENCPKLDDPRCQTVNWLPESLSVITTSECMMSNIPSAFLTILVLLRPWHLTF